MHSRWDDAFGYLHSATEEYIGAERAQDLLDTLHDVAATQSKIADIIEYLYSVGTPRAGARALAWEMLTADPRKPASFSFLPQLQFAIDQAYLEAEDDADMRERIRIWCRASEGEWTDGEVTIFWIADVETRTDVVIPDPDIEPHQMSEPKIAQWFAPSTNHTPPRVIMWPSTLRTKPGNCFFVSVHVRRLADLSLPPERRCLTWLDSIRKSRSVSARSENVGVASMA